MPCYQVQTVSVDFKVDNRDLLNAALKATGWPTVINGNDYTICTSPSTRNILLNLKTGQAIVPQGQQDKINELKRAYSLEALKLTAKLTGWRLQTQSNVKGSLVRSYV